MVAFFVFSIFQCEIVQRTDFDVNSSVSFKIRPLMAGTLDHDRHTYKANQIETFPSSLGREVILSKHFFVFDLTVVTECLS